MKRKQTSRLIITLIWVFLIAGKNIDGGCFKKSPKVGIWTLPNAIVKVFCYICYPYNPLL
jgi:hypothetical protein